MTEVYLLKRPPLCKDHLSTDFICLFLNPHLAVIACMEKILFYATGEILIRTNTWKTTIIKRIYLEHTHFTHVTVIMCNLGPGHSNEVVGHEDRYA